MEGRRVNLYTVLTGETLSGNMHPIRDAVLIESRTYGFHAGVITTFLVMQFQT